MGFIRYGYALGAQQQHDANKTQVTIQTLRNGYLKGADSDATTLVRESQARQTSKAAKAMGALQFAIWAKQCSDSKCIHDLHALLFFEMWEMEAEQKQHPDESTLDVLKKVGPEICRCRKQIIDDLQRACQNAVVLAASVSPTPQRPIRSPHHGATLRRPVDAIAPTGPIPVAPIRRTPAPTSIPTSTLCLFNNGPASWATRLCA